MRIYVEVEYSDKTMYAQSFAGNYAVSTKNQKLELLFSEQDV